MNYDLNYDTNKRKKRDYWAELNFVRSKQKDRRQFQRAECGVASHVLPPLSHCMDVEFVTAAAAPTFVSEHDSYVLQSVLVHYAHSVRLFIACLNYSNRFYGHRSCLLAACPPPPRDTHLWCLQYGRWHSDNRCAHADLQDVKRLISWHSGKQWLATNDNGDDTEAATSATFTASFPRPSSHCVSYVSDAKSGNIHTLLGNILCRVSRNASAKCSPQNYAVVDWHSWMMLHTCTYDKWMAIGRREVLRLFFPVFGFFLCSHFFSRSLFADEIYGYFYVYIRSFRCRRSGRTRTRALNFLIPKYQMTPNTQQTELANEQTKASIWRSFGFYVPKIACILWDHISLQSPQMI